MPIDALIIIFNYYLSSLGATKYHICFYIYFHAYYSLCCCKITTKLYFYFFIGCVEFLDEITEDDDDDSSEMGKYLYICISTYRSILYGSFTPKSHRTDTELTSDWQQTEPTITIGSWLYIDIFITIVYIIYHMWWCFIIKYSGVFIKQYYIFFHFQFQSDGKWVQNPTLNLVKSQSDVSPMCVNAK